MRFAEDMTYQERQAEIERIQVEERGTLSTPLISEGNIDPDAISAMSDRKKRAWGKAHDAKLGLLARIHALSATDADIANRRLSKAQAKLAEQEGRAKSYEHFVGGLGRMAHKKNGALKIGYVRAIEHNKERILTARVELAQLEAGA